MSDLNLIPALLFFGVFCYMVAEDYRFRTIDLRSLILLLLFGLCATTSMLTFLLQMLCGFVFFRFMYSVTAKIYSPDAPIISANVVPQERKGYLPALGAAILIFFASGLEMPKIFLPLLTNCDELAIGAVAVIILAEIFFEYRLYRARKNNFEIIPGFGNGDVYVLAIIGGLVGPEDLMVIFFISLLVQLAEFFCEELKR